MAAELTALFGLAVAALSLWAFVKLRRARRAEIASLPDPPELLHGLSEETMLSYLDDLEGRSQEGETGGEESTNDRPRDANERAEQERSMVSR